MTFQVPAAIQASHRRTVESVAYYGSDMQRLVCEVWFHIRGRRAPWEGGRDRWPASDNNEQDRRHP